MNRERLTILRDHLASLPDEQFDMSDYVNHGDCGTVACVAGWANVLWHALDETDGDEAARILSLNGRQTGALFYPPGFVDSQQTRADAVAAIQSMLDSPDDDALPVWPEKSA